MESWGLFLESPDNVLGLIIFFFKHVIYCYLFVIHKIIHLWLSVEHALHKIELSCPVSYQRAFENDPFSTGLICLIRIIRSEQYKINLSVIVSVKENWFSTAQG